MLNALIIDMDREINYGYTFSFAVVICFGFYYLGYCVNCYNSLTYILHKQYIYAGKYVIEDRDVFNSVVSSMMLVGGMIGSILGGIIAEKGRRRALLILSSAFIADCLLLCVFDFFCLLMGRLLLGVLIGSFSVVSPLYVREIAPKSIAGPIGILNQTMACVGAVFTFVLALFVPLSEDEEANTSDSWRMIFAFPILAAVLQILLLLFVFKYDSPVFYLMHNDKKNYDSVMAKIYKIYFIEFDEEVPLEVTNKPSKDISWSELFSVKYRYALLIGVTLSAAQQATGCGFVTFYSNEIFMQGLSGNEAEKAARIGTFFLGITSLVAVLSAIYMLKIYGRKILMLGGVICIGISHVILFNASITQNTGMVKIAVILFVFIFNNTIGGILWIYASEILSAKGVSLVAQMNNVGGLFFGAMVNIFFNLLTPPGVYMCFILIQILSASFIYFFIKETKGLSMEECESLYVKSDEDKYIELQNNKTKNVED